MSVQVVCLGWHFVPWYPYHYSRLRVDVDSLPCQPFPEELQSLAQRALRETLPQYSTRIMDVAIVNFYAETAKLGLHQDRSEAQQILREGSPIISLSLGNTCLFRWGNPESRTGPYQDIELRSGDLFVFGGESRLAFHGVLKVLPGTAPAGLGIKTGRLNITLRETGFQ